MARKQPARRPVPGGRIVMRTGEALVEDEAAWSAAEPEVVIGDIPRRKANDLGIIVSVWLDPSIVEADYDPEILFRTNREATAKAIGKAMRHEPSIDWLLANQGKVKHYFHDLAVKGEL